MNNLVRYILVIFYEKKILPIYPKNFITWKTQGIKHLTTLSFSFFFQLVIKINSVQLFAIIFQFLLSNTSQFLLLKEEYQFF